MQKKVPTNEEINNHFNELDSNAKLKFLINCQKEKIDYLSDKKERKI